MGNYFKSVQGAVVIGSVLISFSILLHGGIIKLKGLSSGSLPRGNTQETNTDLTPQQKLTNLAKELKLDGKKFESCLSSEKYKDEVQKDLSDASAAGASGTPTFFIGKTNDNNFEGYKIVGAQPYATFKTAIEAALSTGIPTIIDDPQTPDDESKTPIKVSLDDDPVLGDKNSPLTLIEFSDYECPFCKRHFNDTYSQIRKDYIDTGKVKLVFRDLPLSFHDPMATTEAIAANCARELGGDSAYFSFHDEVYKRTKSNKEGI